MHPMGYRKKGYKKATHVKGSAMVIAKKALTAVKILKSKSANELKQNTQTIKNGQVTLAGEVQYMIRIPQGDAVDEREANQVKLKSFQFSGYLYWNTFGNINQNARLWIVKDTQTISDSSPVFTDIFDNNDVNSFPQVSTKGRFKIVKSIFFERNADVTQKHIEFNIAASDIVRWNGVGQTDIQKNHYYLVMVTNLAINCPVFYLKCRTNYYDN